MQNKLRIERAIHEISQEQLADFIGVSRQTIQAMEKNKYAPSVILALRIAAHFGKSVEELFILDDEDFPFGRPQPKDGNIPGQ